MRGQRVRTSTCLYKNYSKPQFFVRSTLVPGSRTSYVRYKSKGAGTTRGSGQVVKTSQ